VSPTDVPGVRVGHWTDAVARTGCTVVLLPAGTIGSGEVRGNGPATRDFALLAPERTMQEIHAVVLTGGSTFGLACVDGVLAELEAQGVGLAVGVTNVPIVPAVACFDLAVGDHAVRPGPREGRLAAQAASEAPVLPARIGAGTGCTVGKWTDPEQRIDAGLGTATVRDGDLIVSALVACNAVGYLGGRRDLGLPFWAPGTATTIGVIVTNARLDKVGCFGLAVSGHDGLARAIDPVHTGLDGDALIAGATGVVDADRDLVRALAARVVEDAVRSVPLGEAGA
jgi:L-aminopeptidase/D-esterase-like protein